MYLQLKEKENTKYQNFGDATKVVPKEKCIVLK